MGGKNICLTILHGMKTQVFAIALRKPLFSLGSSLTTLQMARNLESYLAVPCEAITRENMALSSFSLAPVAFPTSSFEMKLAPDFF